MAEYTIDKFSYGGNTYKLQDSDAISSSDVTTTSITNISAAGTLPSLTLTPNSTTKTLKFGWSAGTLPTTNTQAGVMIDNSLGAIPNGNLVDY